MTICKAKICSYLNLFPSFIPKHGFHFSFPLIQTPKLSRVASLNASSNSIPSLSELDDTVKGYIFGEKKATEVAHLLWKHVVKKGDIVVDATCGNGNDTLAMAKLVNDDMGKGCVYGLDLQEDAIKNTSHLLDLSLDPVERKSVKLFSICHSRMSEVLPKDLFVRLVAFNLGYLPGGDKTIITKSGTTLQALKAAKEILVFREELLVLLLMLDILVEGKNMKLFKVLLQSCGQKAGLAARSRC